MRIGVGLLVLTLTSASSACSVIDALGGSSGVDNLDAATSQPDAPTAADAAEAADAPPADADITGPMVTGTTPLDTATDVAKTSTVEVTFSEPIAMSSVAGAITFQNATGDDIAFTPSASGATLTLTPDSPLRREVQYTVTLGTAITDLAGNALTAAHTLSFTTEDLQWTLGVPIDNVLNPTQLGVGIDDAGRVIALWRTNTTPVQVHANHYTPGAGWGAPVPLPIYTMQSQGRNLIVRPDGTAIAIGTSLDETALIALQYTPTTGWGSPETLMANPIPASPPTDQKLAIAGDGTVMVAWWYQDGKMYASRHVPGSGWSSPEELYNQTGPLTTGRIQLAGDTAGNYMALISPTFTELRWLRYEQGTGWSSHQILTTHSGTDAQIVGHRVAAMPNGFLAVTGKRTDTTQSSESYLYTNGGGWASAVPLTEYPPRDLASNAAGVATLSIDAIAKQYTVSGGWADMVSVPVTPENINKLTVVGSLTIGVYKDGPLGGDANRSLFASIATGNTWAAGQALEDVDLYETFDGVSINRFGEAAVMWRRTITVSPTNGDIVVAVRD